MDDKVIHEDKYFGRLLHWTAVALLAPILATTFLILTGFFDPIPTETNSITIQPASLTTAPQGKQIVWLTTTPTPPFSIRLNVALQSGEIDSGYGLLLGANDAYFGVAVAPTGYLTVWQTGTQDTTILPWQTWPHVKTDKVANEIWLDVSADNTVTIRVNREFLWSGEIDMPIREVGIYGESFGETAVIHFQTK